MGKKFMCNVNFNNILEGQSHISKFVTPNVTTISLNMGKFQSGYIYVIEDITLSNYNKYFDNNTYINIDKNIVGARFYPYHIQSIYSKYQKNNYTINFNYSENNRVLIKGKIFSSKDNFNGITVEIVEINNLGKENTIGSIYTQDGHYSINFSINDNCSYKLVATCIEII